MPTGHQRRPRCRNHGNNESTNARHSHSEKIPMMHPGRLNATLIENLKNNVAWLKAMNISELQGFTDELRGAASRAKEPALLNCYRQLALEELDRRRVPSLSEAGRLIADTGQTEAELLRLEAEDLAER